MSIFSHLGYPPDHPISLDDLEMHAPNTGVVISLGSVAYALCFFAVAAMCVALSFEAVSLVVNAAVWTVAEISKLF